MKRDSFESWIFAALLTLGAVALTSSALAQSGGSYSVTSSTIASGGGTSSSSDGRYRLSGTVGQAAAGSLSGGPYTVFGGFWGMRLVTVGALALLAAVGLGFGLMGSGSRRLRRAAHAEPRHRWRGEPSRFGGRLQE